MKRIKLIGLIAAIISASLIFINFFIGDKVIYVLLDYVYVKPTWNEAVSTAAGISVFAMAAVGLPSFISGYKNFLRNPSEIGIIYARRYTMNQIPLLLLIVFVPFSLIMVAKLANSFGVMIAIIKICREKHIPILREHQSVIAIQILELAAMGLGLTYGFAFMGSV